MVMDFGDLRILSTGNFKFDHALIVEGMGGYNQRWARWLKAFRYELSATCEYDY